MALTNTPENIRQRIRRRMHDDIEGRDKTGFLPYIKNGDIYFDHKWILTIGIKSHSNTTI